jgi:hypothetical protein
MVRPAVLPEGSGGKGRTSAGRGVKGSLVAIALHFVIRGDRGITGDRGFRTPHPTPVTMIIRD